MTSSWLCPVIWQGTQATTTCAGSTGPQHTHYLALTFFLPEVFPFPKFHVDSGPRFCLFNDSGFNAHEILSKKEEEKDNWAVVRQCPSWTASALLAPWWTPENSWFCKGSLAAQTNLELPLHPGSDSDFLILLPLLPVQDNRHVRYIWFVHCKHLENSKKA